MFYIVTYDISDDARRTRLSNELENWGKRVQYSVFECELDASRAEMMTTQLRGLTVNEDRLRVYRVCEACARESVCLRGPDFARDPDFYQV